MLNTNEYAPTLSTLLHQIKVIKFYINIYIGIYNDGILTMKAINEMA